MTIAANVDVLKKYVEKCYRMMKPGGMFYGARVNHSMSPQDFERTKDFGLIYEKTTY
jgi:predicted methyltransferase